jgi:hypothetical protein
VRGRNFVLHYLLVSTTTGNKYHLKMEGQGLSAGLPHLRGGNITLESITTSHPVENRRTKIICTLGPACWEVDQLEKLIDAGMSIARFNFSHGDHEGHLACLNRLRTAASNRNKPIGKDKKRKAFSPLMSFRLCEGTMTWGACSLSLNSSKILKFKFLLSPSPLHASFL